MTPRTRFLAVFAVLLGFEVAKHAALLAAGQPTPILDAAQYWQLGRQMAAGDLSLAEEPIAYRTPGYPALLAAAQLAAASHALVTADAFQHLLVIATSLTTAWITLRVAGYTIDALAAYALCAISLTRAWYANVLLTETVFTFLVIATFMALVAYLQCPRVLRAIALGLLMGFAALVRPIAMLFWIPVAVAMLHGTASSGSTTGWRRRFGHAALVAGVMAVVVAPWWARNDAVFGTPFFTKFAGRSLWGVCFRPGAGADLPFPESPAARRLLDRAAATNPQTDLRHHWRVSEALSASGMSDDRIDDSMKSVAVEALLANPKRFAISAGRRFINYWRVVADPYPYFGAIATADDDVPMGEFREQARCYVESIAEPLAALLDRTPTHGLRFNELVAAWAALGVVALSLHRETRGIGLALGLLLLYFAAATAVMEIPTYRYRAVVEPLMVVAIACGTGQLMRRFARRARSEAVRS